MPPTTLYIGNLSPAEKIMAYNSLVEAGFGKPFDRPQELCYTSLAACKGPDDYGLPPGVVPEKVSFGFSPPNGKAEKLGPSGRHARPLTEHSLEVSIDVYVDTLYEKRKNFQRDVLGILRKVPRDLRRTEAKNPDILLADLFRNGKTRRDYRGEFFWAVNKKVSPEGSVPDTFDSLYTGRPLTEVNLAYVMQQMMSQRGPDGLLLGVKPDTLVVPYTLWHDAILSTNLKQIVFSGTGGAGNLAPGQANNTAAAADNPMATILKWVKKVIVFPELQDGQAVNNTTWYVLDTADGPVSFAYALGLPAEYVSLMDPRDPSVFFQDQYYWGWRKEEGVGYGLPQFAARVEAT